MELEEALARKEGIDFIVWGNAILFTTSNAKLAVQACQRVGLGVLGLDGFYTTTGKRQPDTEWTADFSSLYKLTRPEFQLESWQKALDFLAKAPEELVWELVLADQ
ncbi:hypothetical protein [Hymenobacter persicinus]|uniref:Immunity protein 40 domain-containing protein n=1 Tax=Hymenobacter persicinus TaxID=2025506 RepID=A0A4Q5LDW6_9BACT|nr:hypothetical protein [Hymenobacter persicinus]RYU82126.1 hypothetical protein EWM57_04920 [Hymenobacter persicinus]